MDHDFFKLGGDSISAMRLTAVAREVGLALSVATVFRHSVLHEMCAAVTKEATPHATATTEPFSSLDGITDVEKFLRTVIAPEIRCRADQIEDVLEATDYQNWVTASGHMKSRGYNNYFVFRLFGTLNVRRLKRAVHVLIDRHPILRTVFLAHERQVLQVVMKKYRPEFQFYELSEDFDGIPPRLIQSDLKRADELKSGILRFFLIRQNPHQHRLVMRMSHAQYDGVCLPIIIGDLKAAYAEQTLSASLKYSDFVYWTQSRRSVDSERFWRNLLDGSQMTNVRIRDRPTFHNILDASVYKTVPEPSQSSRGITFATKVKAAWALVLAATSQRSDVVFGQISTGRSGPMKDIQRVVGPCMNILPVRISVPAAGTVSDILRQVQDQHVATLEHENYGFRNIIEKCTSWPKWTRFSSIVQHTNFGDAVGGVHMNELDGHWMAGTKNEKGKGIETDEPDFHLDTIMPPHDVSDLWLWSHPNSEGTYTIQIDYCSSIFSEDLATEILDVLCQTIEELSGDPSAEMPLPTRASEGFPLAVSDIEPLRLRPTKAASLPSTASGKVKSMVSQAWKTVLGPSGNGNMALYRFNTPFYDVWGDMIAAVQLTEHYRRNGGYDISVEDVVQHPTMQMQTELLLRTGMTTT